MSNLPPTILDYRGPPDRQPLPPARRELTYRIGLLCWRIPLILGFLVFLIYLAARTDSLLICGFIVIVLGAGLTLVGGICALLFVISRWGRTDQKWKDAIAPALVLMVLLDRTFLWLRF